jgi:hypothetical protein
VTRACKAENTAYCAARPGQSASGRDQVICLKYHRQDLSLQCRKAVSAVAR